MLGSLNVAANPTESLADSTSRVIDLDEVVVVSQPKENLRLRNLPLSSSVLTTKEMDNLNIRDLSQLSAYVPSFTMPAYGSRLTSSMYVRGIGSRIGSPAVGVYADNIPLVNKSAFNSHFYQIERVDVLRGPQGTLYGMNTEGGVVRMYSKNPMNNQGTDIRLGIGTGLYGNAELSHRFKLGDRLAFSVSAFYNGQKGFFENTNLGKDADLMNEAGAKLRAVWKMSDRFTLDFVSDYQYVNQNGFAYGEWDEATDEWNDPSTTLMNGYRRQMVNTGFTLTGLLSESTTLHSTTSHQYLDDYMVMDQDYLPADFMRLEQSQKMNALTHETTLRGALADSWKHTTGVFLSYQWLRTDAPVYFGADMNSMIISHMGMPPMVAKNLLMDDNYVPGMFHTPQFNIGLYHESNVDLTDRLMLTLGLRYDYQRVSIDYDTRSTFRLDYNGTMQGRPMSTSHTFTSYLQSNHHIDYSQLLPKLALTYRLDNKGNNVYMAVSKGFRAGGYNLQMFSDIFRTEQSQLGAQLMQLMQKDVVVEHTDSEYDNVNNTIAYKPEESWNYELGSRLNLFGGKVHADISAYYMQIRNQQLSVMACRYGYGRMMVNAGKSSSAGVEVALRGSAFNDRLSWSATYGYAYSTFRQYTDSLADGTTDNHRGNYVPFVPKHTFSAAADYSIPVSETALLRTLTIGANVNGNGRIYWDAANKHSQPLYATLGAHVLLDFNLLKLNLWARNITDTRYNTFLVESSADGVARTFSQRNNPFQCGVDLSLSF